LPPSCRLIRILAPTCRHGTLLDHDQRAETRSAARIGAEAEGQAEVQVKDVVVVSQTCDRVNGKVRCDALCPVNRIAELAIS
jgi:hypothetical protein